MRITLLHFILLVYGHRCRVGCILVFAAGDPALIPAGIIFALYLDIGSSPIPREVEMSSYSMWSISGDIK